ncbi:MAG: Fur family transcriptional regulator [Firmicutes bacterium HGW-Firmicutes-16]|nr:MAG: Fur family transcriptional regulator [Firmicutes bacterium HGW-Firmicutes-16]
MAIKRFSKQRELIYEAVRNTTEHPTAETVYSWLKPENPALSLGTVYRNLNQLVAEGSVQRLPFPIERYDANTTPHAHFLCRACGNVYDLVGMCYDSALDRQAERASGHFVEQHELFFGGICAHCSVKK